MHDYMVDLLNIIEKRYTVFQRVKNRYLYTYLVLSLGSMSNFHLIPVAPCPGHWARYEADILLLMNS